MQSSLANSSSKFKLLLFGGAARQFEQPIRDRYTDIEILPVLPKDLEKTDLGGVSCAVGWRFPGEAFIHMPDLRWIQSISVGVDNWVYASSIPEGVTITNTKGLYAHEVAEYILWAMLTLSRRYHLAMRNQVKRRWQQYAGHSLAGRTVGIAGMGHVGRAAATYAKGMGMRTVGLCRNTDDPRAIGIADELVSTSNMDDVLGELDFLVICLPVTDETRGLFGPDELSRIKPGAIVINASRESIVDYKTLVSYIKEGRLAGAALDVFEKEPIRKRSPLWKNENIVITPHVGAFTKEYKTKVSNLVLENLERYRTGQTLHGIVDRSKGY